MKLGKMIGILLLGLISVISRPLEAKGMISPISELDYFNMLKQIDDTYRPLFEKKGINLVIVKNWKDDIQWTDSALEENSYFISVPGGLARHSLMSVDSLALAVCHELGHFFGGAPRKLLSNNAKSWSSVEGQADYFASAKCLKRIFSNRSENRAAFLANPLSLQNEIRKACNNFQCARIVAAAWYLTKTIEEVERKRPFISLSKKDLSIVSRYVEGHPDNQCRLDTFVAGAVCNVSVDEEFDPYDMSAGACVSDGLDPQEAKAARPRCWFAPNKRVFTSK